MARQPKGYVYFVHAPEVGRIKIGWSAEHPDARLTDLRTGSPTVLDRLGYMRGGPDLERQLHAKFRLARWRREREWFEATVELRSFIALNATPWEIRLPSSREDREEVARAMVSVEEINSLFIAWQIEEFDLSGSCKRFDDWCRERGVDPHERRRIPPQAPVVLSPG